MSATTLNKNTYSGPTTRRRFHKLALSVCLTSALGLGFISNAQAHCTILHPWHCVEEGVDAVIDAGETAYNEVIKPVGESIISVGENVVQFSETQFNNAVDDIESTYNDIKNVYNEIKTRVETVANAQKLAHEFAEGIYTDLAMVGLTASNGLKDGRYNSLLNGLKAGNAQQVGEGVLVMLKNMALTPFNNLVNELNRQNAKSLLVGFQVEGGGSVGGVLSIGGSGGSQVGLAIDVAFLNWLQTQLNSNRFILSQLSASNLNQYNGIIGSMYIGGGFGFSGEASVGNLGNSAYIVGFHVNQPFATEGTTMDFETMVGDRAVGVSYNFDKFFEGTMVFEAVAIAYYGDGSTVGGSSAGVGFSAGVSKTIGTLCSDFKFYGGTTSCATISMLGAHGKYAVAENNGDMNANRSNIGSWEKFNLINNIDGSISFLSHHGKYASAQPNGTLVADRSAIGSWEKFKRIDHSDGTVSFKSHHGKYLVAESNGQMNANRTAIGAWEKFKLINASDALAMEPARLKNRWKSNQYIHIEHGAIQSSTINSGWHSAQWFIEPIAGTSYVRLKNRWKSNQYAHIERGAIESSTINSGWHSAQWIIEPVSGTSYVRLKNRWKPNQYVHIEYGRLESSANIWTGAHSSHWLMERDL